MTNSRNLGFRTQCFGARTVQLGSTHRCGAGHGAAEKFVSRPRHHRLACQASMCAEQQSF
jgi:hypothetical protein